MTARVVSELRGVTDVLCDMKILSKAERKSGSITQLTRSEAAESIFTDLIGKPVDKTILKDRISFGPIDVITKGYICDIKAKSGTKFRGKKRTPLLPNKDGQFEIGVDIVIPIDPKHTNVNLREALMKHKGPMEIYYDDGVCMLRRLYGARAKTDLHCMSKKKYDEWYGKKQ